MCRGSISFCLIVVQLSVASGTLNVEQIPSGSDPSSSLSLFPGPDDSGFTGSLALSSSEALMVPFNNGGDLKLASGDNNCAPGPKRRGKRRAGHDDQIFCPNNPQVRQTPTRKSSRRLIGSCSGTLLTGLRDRLSTHPTSPRKQDSSRAVRKVKRPRLNCIRKRQKYQGRRIQTQS